MTRWWHGLIHFTRFTKYTTSWFYHETFRHFLVGNVSLCRLYALEVHKPAFAPKKSLILKVYIKAGKNMHVLKKCFANNATRPHINSKIIGYLLVFVCLRTFDFKIIGSFTVSICMSRALVVWRCCAHLISKSCMSGFSYRFWKGRSHKACRSRVCVCVCVSKEELKFKMEPAFVQYFIFAIDCTSLQLKTWKHAKNTARIKYWERCIHGSTLVSLVK